MAKAIRKLRNVSYTAIDNRCPGYRYPRYVKSGDLLSLDYADNSFDLVICNHALEHIKDDARAIRELYRVCRPNGIAILMVPLQLENALTIEENPDEELSAREREERFGQCDHGRIYGRDYFDRLTAAGFTVGRLTPTPAQARLYALLPAEQLIIARKPQLPQLP